MTAKIDEIGYITHAENLGYSHCWVTDSPIIRSNCWAVLALAAQATRRMRLGTGVNVPALRLAPAAANGIATINRLAPGRCFIGFGTGHTGLRLLGRKPMRLAPFREYVEVVRGCCAARRWTTRWRARRHRIRFQMREHRFIDLDHRSRSTSPASGRRRRRWPARSPTGSSPGCRAAARCPRCWPTRGAAPRGRAGRCRPTSTPRAMVTLVDARAGRGRSTRERIVAECGAAVLSGLHYLVAQHLETGEEPPDYARPIWKAYLDWLDEAPPEVRHQRLHGSHYSFLDPEEARFLTADLIQAHLPGRHAGGAGRAGARARTAGTAGRSCSTRR